MNFDWQHSIKQFLMNNFDDFDRNFRDLVGIVCRKSFTAKDFGFATWDARAIKDLQYDILSSAYGPTLLQLFAASASWGNGRWNLYFVSVIKNHMWGLLRLKSKAPIPIDDVEIGEKDCGLERFEIEDDAYAFCQNLPERSRVVLRGLCADQTLEEITEQIGKEKSTVFNEKRAIISELRKLRYSAHWMQRFLPILCEVAAIFPRRPLSEELQ